MTASFPGRTELVETLTYYPECWAGTCYAFFELGYYGPINETQGTQTFYLYNMMSPVMNDTSNFEVGDTIDIWTIDTKTSNTHNPTFELLSAHSLGTALGVISLLASSLV